jgi:hypothetical protein
MLLTDSSIVLAVVLAAVALVSWRQPSPPEHLEQDALDRKLGAGRISIEEWLNLRTEQRAWHR